MTYLLQIRPYAAVLTEKETGREETIRGLPLNKERQIAIFTSVMELLGHKAQVIRH